MSHNSQYLHKQIAITGRTVPDPDCERTRRAPHWWTPPARLSLSLPGGRRLCRRRGCGRRCPAAVARRVVVGTAIVRAPPIGREGATPVVLTIASLVRSPIVIPSIVVPSVVRMALSTPIVVAPTVVVAPVIVAPGAGWGGRVRGRAKGEGEVALRSPGAAGRAMAGL